ncbi:hypothetical protein [Luteibacter sp. 329MFSha]|uniref:DUF6988 family protein n=1 Tax=Luteibacter sp. 329MFSha TaxID=1798239 RepID=UPI0008C59B17|nr:hypothetical protein [Luteibacter sp. 329MFSha]SEV96577.1 hypothetical protein SAMN04515660_1362 [Luteibacter sp. 329MFSha]
MEELEALIEESHQLHAELWEALEGCHHDGTARGKVSTIFLELAQQHAFAFRCLMAGRLTHSAIPLLRLQFEATVKGFWVNYAATDEWIGKAATVVLKDNRPVEPPGKTVNEMLTALQKTAHPLVGIQLREFEQSNLKPLNSFIHSGISALSTLHRGLPDSFLCQIVRISNGLAGLGATLLAEMANSVEANHALFAVQAAHLGCMPKIRAAGNVDVLTEAAMKASRAG